MDPRATQIAGWLRDRVSDSGARGLVAIVSGDLESALAIRLCQMAAPGQTLAALLPCHDAPASEQEARLVADHFGIPTLRIDLAPAVERLTESLQAAAADVPSAQLPPLEPEGADRRDRGSAEDVVSRVRMTTVYAVAAALEYVVAGSASRTTLMVGSMVKHGDAGVDLFPLGGLLSSEIQALAAAVGVPAAILEKPRRPDADAAALSADLERYLMKGPEGVAPARALRLERMIRASEHKRNPAPAPPHDHTRD
ncbi:MAG: NAD(+) synthase [Vicinamibacterales bacterium]